MLFSLIMGSISLYSYNTRLPENEQYHYEYLKCEKIIYNFKRIDCFKSLEKRINNNQKDLEEKNEEIEENS